MKTMLMITTFLIKFIYLSQYRYVSANSCSMALFGHGYLFQYLVMTECLYTFPAKLTLQVESGFSQALVIANQVASIVLTVANEDKFMKQLEDAIQTFHPYIQTISDQDITRYTRKSTITTTCELFNYSSEIEQLLQTVLRY